MPKKPTTGPYTETEFEKSLDGAFQGLLNQQIIVGGSGDNPYELFNELLQQNKRKRLYNDGKTLPASALALHMEAERAIKHSTKLARNIARAAGLPATKIKDEESHHIVAARASAAEMAREVIFAVGIGINDARNGVNLRRTVHRPIHTDKYYMSANILLYGVPF